MKDSHSSKESGQGLTEEEFDLIVTNPYYCLPKVHEKFFHEHEAMITEEEFIKVGEKMIAEFGIKKYLKLLLQNLKGGDPYPGMTELDVPLGYKFKEPKDEYLTPEEEGKLREFVSNLSHDPEWKERIKTSTAEELTQILRDIGFTREDEEDG